SPARAGMAAARGLDGAGNVIIVAYGGVTTNAVATDQKIYYLASTATWTQVTPVGSPPMVVADGALVFSHITKKFYLHGGINPVAGTLNSETWELSVAGDSSAVNLTFTWRRLDTAGLTCYPNCPQARR